MPELNITIFYAMTFIFLGAFVQSTIGFGLAIVAAPLLILLSPDYVPAPIVIVALFISLFNTLKNRENIQLGRLKSALIARVPGSVIGGVILMNISASLLSLWLGIAVLLSLVVSLLPYKLEPTPNRMAVAGFLSGFMGTTSSIGGPPMAILLQHQEAAAFRGNLSAFFLFSSAISLIVQLFAGYLTLKHVLISLPLLPAAWLGYRAALLCIPYVSKEKIRIAALILCLVSGTSAIWQSGYFTSL